jgi:predicted ATPase/class 3 adenylate cyclase
MSSLPGGTVTFCFTDIEGSTKAFANLGPRFLDVLEDHRRIIRAAIARHGGAEVRTEGDGFFIAFAHPAAALRAVIDLQRAISAHSWPEGGRVRVRAGLHIGEAEPANDDYIAYAVHEAARISASAHGGQTITSEAVVSATKAHLPTDVTLRPLGTHELKDVGALRLYQLCHPELPDVFPALRSAGGVRGYLPSPTSSLIGRAADIADLRDRMASSRLVTVTGAGGIGKTRLAIEAARSALGTRSDGVWFVDLGPVSDPNWIADTLLSALGVVRSPDLQPGEQILSYLAGRDALLVIDNCEHLVDACSAMIGSLLTRCPGVAVLATSQEPLGIAGELIWRLRSLSTSEGVGLFLDRARLVSTVALDETTGAVAQIVDRLDGIPLAIELAAARTRVLTPAQIADRLDDRFRLLTGGSRSATARQRTLEAAVDWSYNLLDEDERALLRSLSVFVGGFELEAAEATGGGDALATLERLVDRSLVGTRLVGDRIRYRLLETIRHYAWMKLVDAGEAGVACARKVGYIADLVDGLADGLRDARECQVTEIFTLELDNIRTALDWALASGDRVNALRMCSNLWLYWDGAGHAREGLEWLQRVLAQDGGLDAELVAMAHAGAGHLAWLVQEPNYVVERHSLLAIGRGRARAAGDARWYDAVALNARSQSLGADLEAASAAAEAVARARRAGDSFTLAAVLMRFAWCQAQWQGPAECLEALAAGVDAARTSGAPSILAYALAEMSDLLAQSGDVAGALALAEEAVAAAHRASHVGFVCSSLAALAVAKELMGDADAAVPLHAIIERAEESQLDGERAGALLALGWLTLGQGHPLEAGAHFDRASSLFGEVAMRRPELLFQWAVCQYGIAECAQADGAFDEGRSIFRQLLALADAAGALRWTVAHTLNGLASLELAAGNVEVADEIYRNAITTLQSANESVARELQARAAAVRGLAAVALARADASRAAFLSGAAAHIFEPNARSGRVSVIRNRAVLAWCREALGDDDFRAQFDRGFALGLDAAGRYVSDAPPD